MTPGQVSAELAMVTPKELRRAKDDARSLGLVDLDLPPLMLAMVVKAEKLSRALGCTRAEAWLLMVKERSELMGYVHQKQPQAAPKKPGEKAVVLMVPEGQALDLVDAGAEPSLSFIDEDDG
jgi:hypothetical protein